MIFEFAKRTATAVVGIYGTFIIFVAKFKSRSTTGLFKFITKFCDHFNGMRNECLVWKFVKLFLIQLFCTFDFLLLSLPFELCIYNLILYNILHLLKPIYLKIVFPNKTCQRRTKILDKDESSVHSFISKRNHVYLQSRIIVCSKSIPSSCSVEYQMGEKKWRFFLVGVIGHFLLWAFEIESRS